MAVRNPKTAKPARSADERERKRFYDSARWKRFRTWYLAQHPLCVECEKRGFTRAAVHLDHVVPLAKDPERNLDPENVQGLCPSCHSAKTGVERSGGTFRHWSDGACGADGLPLSPLHPWNREGGDGEA